MHRPSPRWRHWRAAKPNGGVSVDHLGQSLVAIGEPKRREQRIQRRALPPGHGAEAALDGLRRGKAKRAQQSQSRLVGDL
jgi:hypothetical protein